LGADLHGQQVADVVHEDLDKVRGTKEKKKKSAIVFIF
jgi:hypothetical protein